MAPGLRDIDTGNDDSAFSAVERIFMVRNGPTGCDNPQRQGLNSALIDGQGPLNVLGGIPTLANDYSPLWDANLGEWTQDAIDRGFRARVIEEFQILTLVEGGFLTGLDGAPFGSIREIINQAQGVQSSPVAIKPGRRPYGLRYSVMGKDAEDYWAAFEEIGG